ncbi:hypothetical protein V3I05_06710 [Helicobacter mastomyrinus]|uniref:Uncharacterized protein n=1 Tax=Helicobacter mastomyrinus TaxID=287948 RepID=A0ABZ3F4Q7_9HELI
MSNTIKFQCHIQISNEKLLDEVAGKTLSFMGNSKTIDANGEVIFDCELQERDKHKSFPITIEDEEYIIVGTGQCNAIAHQKSTNPFCLALNKDDEANIRDIRIYKEQDKVDSEKQEQIDIYTAQVEKREDTATQQTSTDDIHTSQTPLQENQNLIHLEAYLTSGKALKKDIHWAYYVKYRNEALWEKSKIKKENLESLTFTQKAKHNTQVSFDINAKFKYTIKEDEIQKEVEDYLKEKQQLIIFAYKNNPAYQTSNGQTHTILNISTLPIVEISYNTLTLLYKNTQKSFQIDNTIMSHLREDFTEDKEYELGLNKTNDYLVLKSNNKLYKIYKDTSNNIAQSSLGNTQESNPTQNNQNPNNTQTSNTQQQTNTDSLYLKENKDFDEIKTILELTEKEEYQGVKVWVEVEDLRLSGKEWVKEYKDRASIEDLSSPFKENVKDFLKALDEAKKKTPQAKITYYISSTRRPYERAVLMHYCHKVAYNNITPQQAQQATQKENIPINWIHTDSTGNYSEKISREKALEMVKAYGIAYPASLTSHHVRGNAIDITITWQSSFTIKDKTGKEYIIDIPRNGATNPELRKVGKTYGVKRTLEKDPPHWSLEGN